MVGILIVTHGHFGRELLKSCELITGTVKNASTLSLEKDDDINELSIAFSKKIKELDNKKGIIVFVDMLGGSPCNVAALNLKKIGGFELVTGVNLPMLVETILSRESVPVEELMETLVGNSQTSIKWLNHELES